MRSKWRHPQQKRNRGENPGAERKKCEGKGGQEPQVRLQSFNEKENFSCQYVRLFLFPNVRLKADGACQGGATDGSRVPVLCSHLAYRKMPGPQEDSRDPVSSWVEALGPSATVFQPVIHGNFRSPWVPGLHTLPAAPSGWAHSLG